MLQTASSLLSLPDSELGTPRSPRTPGGSRGGAELPSLSRSPSGKLKLLHSRGHHLRLLFKEVKAIMVCEKEKEKDGENRMV